VFVCDAKTRSGITHRSHISFSLVSLNNDFVTLTVKKDISSGLFAKICSGGAD
jgi:hypothetical protein